MRAAGRDYRYDFLPACGSVPKLFISGDHDEFSPRGTLEAYLVSASQPREILFIEGADHFFAGVPGSPEPKLEQMSTALRSLARGRIRSYTTSVDRPALRMGFH